MKLRVDIMRSIEVETSDPIFQELYWTHVQDDIAENEKYEKAFEIIEQLTGFSFRPSGKNDEAIVGVYEANTYTPIVVE